MLGNGAGDFATAAGGPIDVGGGPSSIAVADFNGDGIQDLAVANASIGNVTVLLGNGSGGFSPAAASPFATGTSPVSIIAADFNNDGKADLATANATANNLTVLLGNGAGGFSAASASPIAVGSHPSSIVSGDFNGDGIPDLAAANKNDNTVSVFLGNGSGGFTAAPNNPYITDVGPASIVAGDFDGDGIVDLATANTTVGNISMLLGLGSGGFVTANSTSFPADIQAYSLVAADLNGDGRLDLAVANAGGNDVTVRLGAVVTSNSVISTTVPSTVSSGTTVPLTLTLTAPGTFRVPTGTVTFKDAGTTLGSASQNSSPFTFTTLGLSNGTHTLTAVYGGNPATSVSTSNTITIQAGTTQTITFAPRALAAEPHSARIGAMASSGLPVTFTSNSSSICTVTSGGTVSLVSVGQCSITADQAGDSTYLAASPVTQTFNVFGGSQDHHVRRDSQSDSGYLTVPDLRAVQFIAGGNAEFADRNRLQDDCRAGNTAHCGDVYDTGVSKR